MKGGVLIKVVLDIKVLDDKDVYLDGFCITQNGNFSKSDVNILVSNLEKLFETKAKWLVSV